MNTQYFLRNLAAITFSVLTTFTRAWAGQVTTDGTVGTATTLNGPHYSIPQSLGTTAGNNLFHSFHRFNLSQDDVAEFTGAHTIQNVISRVTGSEASSINGTIRSKIGNANFFFLNPAGVIFGEHALVDVPAAFHVSTAHALRFTDGSSYPATIPAGSSFTSASPEAFGFLRPTGAIHVHNSHLDFQNGSTLNLVAASVTTNDAALIVPQGNLRVYGQGDPPGAVAIAGDLPSGNGNVIIQGGHLDVSGAGGGNLQISGAAINITDGADLDNHNNSATDAIGKIQINANTLRIADGSIATDTTERGQGSDIVINVSNNMLLLNQALKISASSHGSGNSGNITVNAQNLIIDGQGSQAGLGIGPGIASDAYATGKAGEIKLNINEEMQIVNGSGISTDAYGSGDAGAIVVKTQKLTIDGKGLKLWGTGIASDSFGQGNAGTLFIEVAKEILVLNEGVISSSTFSKGDGGKITVQAGNLTVDGGGIQQWGTGIGSQANLGSSGNAGNVNINISGALRMDNGGGISSSTLSVGDAGTVSIKARSLTIDPGNTEMDTGIASRAFPGATGNAGVVNVTVAGDAQIIGTPLRWNGGISSANFGIKEAGAINIAISRHLYLTGGTIETSAQVGNGGPIMITAPVLVITNSQIVTSVEAQGNGGDITINGNYLVMDTGFIQANTAELGAQGGDIFINEVGVIGTCGIVAIGGHTREMFITDARKNVIQAAAPDGINGDITLTSPDTSTAAGLTAVADHRLDMRPLTNPCIGRKQRSSLGINGRGGLPASVLDSVMIGG